MELSLLINQMKYKWNEYSKHLTPPHPDQGKEQYLQNLTAQLAFTKMNQVIQRLESGVFDLKGPVTRNHIKLIASCFEEHFNGIKSTNKVYFTSTDTPDTLLYLDIATYLTGTNNLARGKNKYQLMAPSVVTWFNAVKSVNLANRPLHCIILSDGNNEAIDVGFVDNNPQKRGLVLWYNTDPLVEAANKMQLLTASERSRICQHSDLLKTYYKLRQDEGKYDGANTSASDSMNPTIYAALNNEKYNGHKVTASYENCKTPGNLSGYPKLEAYLLDNVDRLFLNRQQLFDYMYSQLQPSEWEGFVAKMDPDVFFNLVIGSDSSLIATDIDKMSKIQQVLTAETILDCDQKYKNLILFCLESAYWNLRDENPAEFTSKIVNALAMTPLPATLFAYPKSSKGISDRDIKNFLIGKDGYTGDKFTQQFLNPAITDARNDGVQGLIFQLMCKHLKSSQTVIPGMKKQ